MRTLFGLCVVACLCLTWTPADAGGCQQQIQAVQAFAAPVYAPQFVQVAPVVVPQYVQQVQQVQAVYAAPVIQQRLKVVSPIQRVKVVNPIQRRQVIVQKQRLRVINH